VTFLSLFWVCGRVCESAEAFRLKSFHSLRRRERARQLGLLGGLFLSFTGLLSADESIANQHTQLRSVLDQWMETVDRAQVLESNWANEQFELQGSIEGLRTMLVSADEAIAEVEGRLELAGGESQEKRKEMESFEAAREAFAKGLKPVEEEVGKVVKLLPEFFTSGTEATAKLKGSIEELNTALAANPDELAKMSLNKRLKPLVQIVTEAERFNEKIWAVTHFLTVGGAEKNMNVIYFGLGAAYAVDEEQTVALQGQNGPQGWKFTEMSGENIPAEVLVLYNSAKGAGETRMVSLPLNLVIGGEE